MKCDHDDIVMRQVLRLAEKGWSENGYPFGAKIVHAKGMSFHAWGQPGVMGHPEMQVMERAVKSWGSNLTGCTLYSNLEPCAACAAVAKDYAVGRIVYAMPSPHWGGADRWPILHSLIDADYTAAGVDIVPDVVSGVLRKEAEALFDRIGWTMHKDVPRETYETLDRRFSTTAGRLVALGEKQRGSDCPVE